MLRNTVTRKLGKAKEEWIKQTCDEVGENMYEDNIEKAYKTTRRQFRVLSTKDKLKMHGKSIYTVYMEENTCHNTH